MLRLRYACPALDRYNTLTLHRVFPNKVEARAEYFVDLYKPLRFRTANASLIVDLVNEKQPYICPHLDLTQVLHRFMASHPVNFGGQPPSHDPVHTLAEVMVRAMEKKPWEPTPEHRHFIRPLCKIKEQSIWCGFKGNKCRTEVTLQRFRDNERWTVGWMRDLVRLKVVRKWRVDRGTRDKEWQAQNGTSAMASVVVKRKGSTSSSVCVYYATAVFIIRALGYLMYGLVSLDGNIRD
ncbi:hypothetical protein N0V87_008751 [Didymella glomerata]|uniref:Uncharacterized protein n=1 Tax=Didymella glomerata TaxID=749621 RepID=A0A9W9BVU1_9PLEO|nr:hypothetical protein N0V87_008751 [Didymella glomerata]